MGAHPAMAALTGPEKGRAHKLYAMMDLDNSGTIEVDEICIVHDSDKDNMIKKLDANGDNMVDRAEWISYMEMKKAEKGDKKFGFFLNYLEKEIPLKIPAMKIQAAKKRANPQAAKKAIQAAKKPVKGAKKTAKKEEEYDIVDILFECPHATHGLPVPESVKKKREAQEALKLAKAEEAANAKTSRKAKRNDAYNNAEAYAKEYRAIAKRQVRMRRQAKAAGNHFVEAEAKLMFVVRIRGLCDMHPKTKKILQLMRLRQMNMGVFMKVSKAATEMLKRVEPYISYGYPNVKSVKDLIYKRGYGKVNKNRIPLTDNAIIEDALGNKCGIKCMEDLVHEIVTVGPHFREANNFLWPFKLRPAKGGQAKKRKGFCEGGQAGNREDLMNRLIAKML